MNIIMFKIEILIAFVTEYNVTAFIGKYKAKHFSADITTRNEADRCIDVCMMNLVSLQSIQSLPFSCQSFRYCTQIGKAPTTKNTYKRKEKQYGACNTLACDGQPTNLLPNGLTLFTSGNFEKLLIN